MFLHHFNQAQREAFLSLAARLMSADAAFHDAELAQHTTMREEMGIAADWIPSNASTDDLLSQFTDLKSKKIALIEIMVLARADEVLPPEERVFLQHIIHAFDLQPAVVKNLARWVRQYTDVMKNGERLVQPQA